jgi:hypothetical protein
MGGIGSGNWTRMHTKDLVEKFMALDVNILVRSGIIKEGHIRHGRLRWSGDREAIEYEARADLDPPYLQVRYIIDGTVKGNHTIYLTRTFPPFGGHRWWFICPGSGCGRRVGRLYVGRDFLCRHCRGLVYESQRKSASFRVLSRSQKIRRRLGGSGGLSDPFPDKPKAMHWKTYFRLQDEAMRAEDLGWRMVSARIGDLGKRLERI